MKKINFLHILTTEKDIKEIKKQANEKMNSKFENFDPVITSVSKLWRASQEEIDYIAKLLEQGRAFNKIVIIQLDAELSLLKDKITTFKVRNEKFINYINANCITL